MIVRSSLPDFVLLSNIEKQTLFNHYVCSTLFFGMSLKILKSEKTSSNSCDRVFLSAEFVVSDSFDVRHIIFRLHLHFIILLIDLCFSLGIIMAFLLELHAWDNYNPSSHIALFNKKASRNLSIPKSLLEHKLEL